MATKYATYKLLAGKHSRPENGQNVTYQRGAVIVLSSEEAKKFAPNRLQYVGPADGPVATADKIAPGTERVTVEASHVPDHGDDDDDTGEDDMDWTAWLGGSIKEVTDAIGQLTDPAEVESYIKAESSRKDRSPRKSLIEAATAHLASLKAA